MEEAMKSSVSPRPGLVLSAVGPDRSGMVFDLASFINARGGNIEDTRMTKLGGEFALLALITGSEASLSEIVASLKQLELALGVTCFIKQTTSTKAASGRLIRFTASGFDRPGIVESISSVLSTQGINVTSFLSRIENAPLTGTPLFVLEAEGHIPDSVTQAEVETALQGAAEREQLEIAFAESQSRA